MVIKDIECPYCGRAIDICHDDGYGYKEGELHNQECPKCEKVFTYTTCISFSYTAYEADCLNGGEHKFSKTDTYPPECARLRCGLCGEEKPLPLLRTIE